ncbi:diaminopimelate decarboxylase [Candidatus Uhrbacteria bacterium]|nr:diaminopimelate decarboxylase [Candidatus Uhrbacteria bacterium]
MNELSQRYSRPRWDYLGETKSGILTIEGLPVTEIAKKYGTPCYIMVERAIRQRFREFKAAFPYPKLRVQYASKCNSNLEIMRIANQEGVELDASSIGEVILALLADFSPHEITLTNLYKTPQDILFAVKVGVLAITADSLEDLELIAQVGKSINKKIRIFIRLTPTIDLGQYTTRKVQYGIPYAQYKKACDFAARSPYLNPIGLHFHGPYVYNPKVYFIAAKKLVDVAEYMIREHNQKISYIDLGGSFPVAYGDTEVFHPRDMGKKFSDYFVKLIYKANLPLPYLVFEPGKFFVANTGVGLTRVISKKLRRTTTLVVDGSTYAFLPDPIIYEDAVYDILPASKMQQRRSQHYKIAGCTCDCIDTICKSVHLPQTKPGDLLAIMDCGAYSNTIASNFNSLKRAPMVMVNEEGVARLIRRRDRFSDMFAPELDVLKVADPHELQRYYNLFRVNINKMWGEHKEKKSPVRGRFSSQSKRRAKKSPPAQPLATPDLSNPITTATT